MMLLAAGAADAAASHAAAAAAGDNSCGATIQGFRGNRRNTARAGSHLLPAANPTAWGRGLAAWRQQGQRLSFESVLGHGVSIGRPLALTDD